MYYKMWSRGKRGMDGFMKNTENKRLITLIGMPLSQSFAARMQNAGYRAAGLPYHYFYTEAGRDRLGEIIDEVRRDPAFAGCAVTKPNKVAVLQYLDEVDPLCARIGACNTVCKTADGRLVGYNTDAIGFLQSFRNSSGLEIRGSSFFCFGAGGVGRAICCALAEAGAGEILITDVVRESAEDLAEAINRQAEMRKGAAGTGLEKKGQEQSQRWVPLPDRKKNSCYRSVAKVVAPGDFSGTGQCQAIINASGIGFGETVGQTPLPAELIRPEQVCFDACYNPARTRFLQEAAAKGCRVLNGLEMSLLQGAAQIRLWTGEEAPVDVMEAELEQILRERSAEIS